MRVKKILPLFLAIIFLITAGFGCKGMSTAEQQATKPVVLEYWTVYGNVDALQKQIGVFRSNHPYVSVNLRQLRADELYPRLIEALAEDRGPDIISVSNRDIGKFLTKLSPMPASVSDTVVTYQKNTIGNGVTALVNTQTRNLLTPDLLDQQYIKVVRNDVVRQGNIVGLPLSVDMLAVYYNKDLLDRSNVAEPPKNWNDFQDDVKKITRYDRKTGGIIQFGAAFGTGQNISASDDLLYVLFRQSGGGFCK
jgi:multiple sugar transport system substrate-binding protein